MCAFLYRDYKTFYIFNPNGMNLIFQRFTMFILLVAVPQAFKYVNKLHGTCCYRSYRIYYLYKLASIATKSMTGKTAYGIVIIMDIVVEMISTVRNMIELQDLCILKRFIPFCSSIHHKFSNLPMKCGFI